MALKGPGVIDSQRLAKALQGPLAPLYTVVDWQHDLAAKEVCQCLTLKIGPDGNTIGNSRPCRCDE